MNPYQPGRSNAELAAHSDPAGDEQLAFGGVITAHDFAVMIPHRTIVQFLLVVVTPVCVLCAVTAIMMALAEVNRSPWTLPMVLAVGAVLIGMPIGAYQLLATQRAGRILKRRPDLLGTVQGTISVDGMLLNDGLRRHWFSATSIRQSRVLKSGVRVQLAQDPYHFLALSTRLFDHFDPDRLKSWLRQWRHRTATTPPSTPPIACATRLGMPPADAVNFAGQVTLQMPTDTPESRKQAWSLTAQLVIAFAVLILACLSEPGNWNGFTLAALLATISYAWAVFATWRLILQGSKPHTITQSGWIGENELLIESAGNASRCPLSCFHIHPIHDQDVIWFAGELSMIAITKDILASMDEWQRLIDRFPAR